ncbi:MAG: tRNA uridine-5-carboxymethylaminomethyl(34) synthesis GTPase MnmE, partial [Hyphomicrobiales bacterium]
MTMRAGDTIVALSSGALPSGVAVIRVSGPASRSILQAIQPKGAAPRRLLLADIGFGGLVIDRGLLAWMPGPHSFTGEDCLELQVHGSPAGVRAILREITRFTDVRPAEAGEFTRRAFENGKLDLTEVEGLGDLIGAETEGQRKQALARAGGGLSQTLDAWRERLLDLRAEIEARLDFSDESDVDALPESLIDALAELRQEFAEAAQAVSGGRIVREGFRVALAGRPNAGKSSLLNALAKSDVAIVTDEAGTTRDIKEVPLDLGGQLVILVDMAGLRNTDSKAEAEGVRRARAEIESADLVLWLQAVDEDPDNMIPPDAWLLHTKADLGTRREGRQVSTQTGDGVSALLEDLRRQAESRVGAEA